MSAVTAILTTKTMPTATMILRIMTFVSTIIPATMRMTIKTIATTNITTTIKIHSDINNEKKE